MRSGDDPETLPRALQLTVALGAVGGLALRVLFLVLRSGQLDSDEAIVGLMAIHALRDADLNTFFWGQSYGGTLEALLAVPGFALFGPSVLLLKLVPMTLSAVCALLVWRLGRATVGNRAGAVAGVAMWLWPATMVWFSTKERGFYWVCLALGLMFLLIALEVVRRPDRVVPWLALGLLGGVGWWTSPQILYFVVPGLVWVAAHRAGELKRLVVSLTAYALPSAVVGSLPWLLYNASHHWQSLYPTNHFNDKGIVGNAWRLVSTGWPVILGLHINQEWIVPTVFPLLYIAVLLWLVRRALQQPSRTLLPVVALLTYIPIYARFPVSGVIGEGRYVLFALPFFALLIAHALRRPAFQIAFVVAVATLTATTIRPIVDASGQYAVDERVPSNFGPLLDMLEHDGVRRVVADYWVAYRITFETDRKVIAASFTDNRYLPYQEAVRGSEDVAWVFLDGTYLIEPFEQELARRKIAARRTTVAEFVVFQPERPLVCWPSAWPERQTCD